MPGSQEDFIDPPLSSSSFFISIKGDGDPILISSDDYNRASRASNDGDCQSKPTSLSSNFLKNSTLEERFNIYRNRSRSSNNISLEPSLCTFLQDAHIERRTWALQTKQQRLAAQDRRKRETVVQVRRRQEREQREQWARMREREFLVQYRRERLKHVPRSKLLEAEVRTEQLTTMASLIEMTWLRRQWRPFLSEFLATGILELAEEGTNYERMQEVMLQSSTIRVATQMILQLIKCDFITARLTRTSKAGRILLTALLLDGFGTQVMPEASPKELTLLEHAGQLVESLCLFLNQPTRLYQLRLVECWSQFNETFSSWQKVSQATLVQDLQEDYLVLARITTNLGNGPAQMEWQPHIQRHQQRLKKALRRVAGPSALDELQVKLQALNLNLDNDNNLRESDPKPLIVPTFEQERISPEEIRRVQQAFKVGQEKKKRETNNEYNDNNGANDNNVDSDDISNIIMAHELMVDPKFNFTKLMAIKKSKVEQSASTTLNVPFNLDLDEIHINWEVFIFEMKRQLLEMVKGQGEVAQDLEEQLEEAYIKEGLQRNTLPLLPIFEVLLQAMSKVCAPMRDELITQTRQALKNGELTLSQVARKITQIMEHLHEDLINFGLTMIRPRLARIIVSYEREWFRMQGNDLTKTKPIVHTVIKDGWSMEQGKTILESIYSLALEVILVCLSSSHHQLPEVLTLDKSRLTRLRRHLVMIAKISAIALVLRNGHHPDLELIMDRIIKLWESEASTTLIITEITASLPLDYDKDQVIGLIGAILTSPLEEKKEQPDQAEPDKMSRLIFKSMLDIIKRTLIMATGAGTGTEFINKPASILIRQGIVEQLTDQFNGILEELLRMYRLHREVMAPIYYQVVQVKDDGGEN